MKNNVFIKCFIITTVIFFYGLIVTTYADTSEEVGFRETMPNDGFVAVKKVFFEEETGLLLPDNARVLGYRLTKGLDYLYEAKLQVNKKEFLAWNEEYLHLSFEEYSDNFRWLLDGDVGFWVPDKKIALPTLSINSDNAVNRLIIGYQDIGDDTVIVWLRFFGK